MKKESLINILNTLGFKLVRGSTSKWFYQEPMLILYVNFEKTYRGENVEISFFTNLFFSKSIERMNIEILFNELSKFLRTSEEFQKIRFEMIRDYKLDLLLQ
jgi:hypothetical protein